MPKLYKRVKENEQKCKDVHKNMNLAGIPARLEPNLFLIADTDDLQRQVNRIENKINAIERERKKSKWRTAIARKGGVFR